MTAALAALALAVLAAQAYTAVVLLGVRDQVADLDMAVAAALDPAPPEVTTDA